VSEVLSLPVLSVPGAREPKARIIIEIVFDPRLHDFQAVKLGRQGTGHGCGFGVLAAICAARAVLRFRPSGPEENSSSAIAGTGQGFGSGNRFFSTSAAFPLRERRSWEIRIKSRRRFSRPHR